MLKNLLTNSILYLATTFCLLFGCYTSCAQSFNEDKTALSNFVNRMYKNTKFEELKVIVDYDHLCLVSVIILEKVKFTGLYFYFETKC